MELIWQGVVTWLCLQALSRQNAELERRERIKAEMSVSKRMKDRKARIQAKGSSCSDKQEARVGLCDNPLQP